MISVLILVFNGCAEQSIPSESHEARVTNAPDDKVAVIALPAVVDEEPVVVGLIPKVPEVIIVPAPIAVPLYPGFALPIGGSGGSNRSSSIPSLSLEKTADEAAQQNIVVDQVITYTFTIRNTGNVPLTDIEVTDTLEGLSLIDCGNGTNILTSLAPGEASECIATYTVTQANIDAGQVTNTATATGYSSTALEVTDEDEEVLTAEQTPNINLLKQATALDFVAGSTINYVFDIANTGNVTLTNVTVTDELPDVSVIVCPATTLGAGESMLCTASYTIQQSDVAAGQVTNTATVTGLPPEGPIVSDDDSETVPEPAIEIVKTADDAAQQSIAVDQVVTYTFTVTNTGNVTLTNVTVTDPLVGLSAIDCGSGTNVVPLLVPQAEAQCLATYTVTQANVDEGQLSNTATVIGVPPIGANVSDNDVETVIAQQEPSITLEKTAIASDFVQGSTINYEFLVTNTGNVSLTGITVTDPLAGLSPILCPGTELLSGATMTCTATYLVTSEDIVAGQVTNTAGVSGAPPIGPNVTDDDSTTLPSPSIAIVKTADDAALLNVVVDQVVTYTFTVTNPGNVPLNDILVTDPFSGLSAIDCGSGNNLIATLAPGSSQDCTATYTVTQDDVDLGQITNTASAAGCFMTLCTQDSDEERVPGVVLDFGDAPEVYATSLTDGARHSVVDFVANTNTAPLMLGTSIDTEADGVPGPDADGDDLDGDDEDAIAGAITVNNVENNTITISVTNNTNADATLAGWIDLNGDDVFALGERLVTTIPANSGTASYDLIFPPSSTSGTTYARLRLFAGVIADPQPIGPASGGEVEDYEVTAVIVPQQICFNSVALIANPNNWTITGLANTVNGNVIGTVYARIFTGQQNATGVVIDYAFTVPKMQITTLQLYNNGGGILNDADGIGTALVQVFDPSNNLLFSGPLNAGNGGAVFNTVLPVPLNNVSRVRFTNLTNLLPGQGAAPDIIWREVCALHGN